MKIRNHLLNAGAFLLLVILLGIFLKSVYINHVESYAKDRNLYLYEAEAFINGDLHVSGDPFDAAKYQDKTYVPYPPIPAILLIPFVLALGVDQVSTVMVSLILSGLILILLIRLLKLENLSRTTLVWVLVAFFFGSPFWFVLNSSDQVWFFAHIVAITALFLAINEAKFQGRAGLVGLFLGLSVLSRQMTIYSFPFLMILLVQNPLNMQRKTKTITSFSIAFCLCLVFLLYFNWLRFGSPFDSGYEHIPLGGYLKARVDQYGMFSLMYLPFNLLHYIFQGFHFEFTGEDLLKPQGMSPFGTSITQSMPFILVAFWADWNRKVLGAAWMAIIFTIFHQSLYYGNGWVQFHSYRFALDYLPILILLVGSGIKHVQKGVWMLLISYAVTLNILAKALAYWSRHS